MRMNVNVKIECFVDPDGYELCDYLGRFTDQPRSEIYFDRKENLLLLDNYDDFEYVVDDPEQELDEDELLKKYAPTCFYYSDENFYGRLAGQDAEWEDGKWLLTFSGPIILTRWVTHTSYEGLHSYRYIDNLHNWDDEGYDLEYIIQDIKRLEGYTWGAWWYEYWVVTLNMGGATFKEVSPSFESDSGAVGRREALQEAFDEIITTYENFITSGFDSSDVIKSLLNEKAEEIL